MRNENNFVKNQHYVPVCYLANFGINGNQGRESTIFFYNFINKHLGEANVNTFPKESYFYDIDELGDNKQIIDEVYSQLEGEYSELLKEVLVLAEQRENLLLSLSNKKHKLADFFAIQIERSKAIREYYKAVYYELKSKLPSEYIPDYDKNDFKRLHNISILDGRLANFYANLFSDRKWVFLVNHTDVPFVTSDNPCIQINHSNDMNEIISPVSIKATHYIPLSPSLAIEIYEKNISRNDFSYFDFYRKEHIIWYNLNMKEQCTMYLFSNKNNFDYLINRGYYDQI